MVTDSSLKPTTGKITKYIADDFATGATSGNLASNGDIDFTVKANRTIHIESTITSGSGKKNNVVFTQSLAYSNTQTYLQDFFIQVSQITLQLD